MELAVREGYGIDRSVALEAPSLDSLLWALADPRRREVLWVLRRTADGWVDRESLLSTLEGLEAGSVDSVESTDRERLEIRLHHEILPSLADVGLIRYDPETGRVRYRESRRCEALLDCVAEIGSGSR